MFRFLALFILMTNCLFAETKTVLPKDETVKGNYYLTGKSIEIAGTVEGNLYVVGTQVIIQGNVLGNLIFLCAEMQIDGNVYGNIRGSCAQFNQNGWVGKNINVLAASSQFSHKSISSGRVVLLSATTAMEGIIADKLLIYGSVARLDMDAKSNVEVHATNVTFGTNMYVEGNLDYYSEEEATIEKGAKVVGQYSYHPSFLKDVQSNLAIKKLRIGSIIATNIMNFVYSFILGLIIMRFFKKRLQKSFSAIDHSWIKTLLYGVLVIVVLPIIALMLLISIVGLPFALMVVALNVLGLYTAKIVTITYITSKFKKYAMGQWQRSLFCIGLIIYFLLTMIPFVGNIIAFIVTAMGLGAAVFASNRNDLVFLEKH